MPIQPIFIFSVSRSGSTLVQRIIAAHDDIATVSEPWILLPLLYSQRREGVVADYVHPLMVTAINDFCDTLPEGKGDYQRELREFVLSLYRQAAGSEARYFLDKSPPYYLVAQEIMRLFPEGKFIFLWRNPLSIISSLIDTWEDGKWHPTMFRGDLFDGLPRLVAAYQASSRGNAFSVRFEDLVTRDERRWTEMMRYLDMDFDRDALNRFSSIQLNGRMGDPVGTKRYARVTADPAEKWKGSFGNPLRKSWCLRYLRFLGEERLAVMGYSMEELITELKAQPMGKESLLSDLGRTVIDVAKEPIRVRFREQGLGGPNVIRELLTSNTAGSSV